MDYIQAVKRRRIGLPPAAMLDPWLVLTMPM
jgi:hypothetical protein